MKFMSKQRFVSSDESIKTVLSWPIELGSKVMNTEEVLSLHQEITHRYVQDALAYSLVTAEEDLERARNVINALRAL